MNGEHPPEEEKTKPIERGHLHLVQGPEEPNSVVTEPELINMSVWDIDELKELLRSPIASRIEIEGVEPVNRIVRKFIDSHIKGRIGRIFQEEGNLYIHFKVKDRSKETVERVQTFADEVATLVGGDVVLVSFIETAPLAPNEGA